MKQEQDLEFPVLQSNEILLDISSLSEQHKSPTIEWKIKDKTTVRTGEIIAQYSISSSTTTETSSSCNVVGDDSLSNHTMSAESSNDSSNKGSITETKQIRPRRRNRVGPPKSIIEKKHVIGSNHQSKSISGRSDTNTEQNLKMEDWMKSMDGRIKELGETKKTNVAQAVSVDERLKQHENSNGIMQEITSEISTTRDVTKEMNNTERSIVNQGENEQKASKTQYIPIRATMNGFVHIYNGIQRRRRADETGSWSGDNHATALVLGKIEPCKHPAVIDSLCAVCGQSVHHSMLNDQDNNSQNLHPHMAQQQNQNKNKRDAFTLSGGVTLSISQDYAKTLSTDTSQSLRATRKLNLVLDLDHTLLHATADKRALKSLFSCDDVHTMLLPMMEGHPLQHLNSGVQMWQPHYVKLRPHLAEFICDLMDKYEITIYTAGTRTYANKIADVISRHVLDYQHYLNKNVDKTNGCKKKCLDEGELTALRQTVARTRERMQWDKSRQEREEYVKRMNEQFKSEKERKNKEDSTKDDISDTKNIDDEINEENSVQQQSQNTKKRKRVTFCNSVDKQNEITGTKEESEIKSDLSELTKASKNSEEVQEANQEDATEGFKTLQKQLKDAEEREIEAQSLRKKIFGSRIISRTDVSDLGRDVKSLKRVFPCSGKMAAIVDDREDVWANADNNSTGRKGEPPINMILVRPYHFGPFLKFADVNNSSGEDLAEEQGEISKRNKNGNIDETGEEQLLWTGSILKRLHARYYNEALSEDDRNKLNVPLILSEMRKEVLSGSFSQAKVLLSGLIPLHLQKSYISTTQIPRPPVIRYAEELGAKVMNNICDDLTHVIAAKDGTDKILRARRISGCSIVKIGWLMECYWSISQRNLGPHYLGPEPVRQVDDQKEDLLKKLLLSGSDDDDDDEAKDDVLPRRIEEIIEKNERILLTNNRPASEYLRWHYMLGHPLHQRMKDMIEKGTRTDIAYAVHQCARFCEDPSKEQHVQAVILLTKYLKDTRDKGIILKPTVKSSFEVWVDAEFSGNWNKRTAAEDVSTTKSRSGYVIMYGGCPIFRTSKLQGQIALSSCEAEYISLSHSLRDAIPMMRLMQELKDNGLEDMYTKPLAQNLFVNKFRKAIQDW